MHYFCGLAMNGDVNGDTKGGIKGRHCRRTLRCEFSGKHQWHPPAARQVTNKVRVVAQSPIERVKAQGHQSTCILSKPRIAFVKLIVSNIDHDQIAVRSTDPLSHNQTNMKRNVEIWAQGRDGLRWQI